METNVPKFKISTVLISNETNATVQLYILGHVHSLQHLFCFIYLGRVTIISRRL